LRGDVIGSFVIGIVKIFSRGLEQNLEPIDLQHIRPKTHFNQADKRNESMAYINDIIAAAKEVKEATNPLVLALPYSISEKPFHAPLKFTTLIINEIKPNIPQNPTPVKISLDNIPPKNASEETLKIPVCTAKDLRVCKCLSLIID
jgi:hypothetical protein